MRKYGVKRFAKHLISESTSEIFCGIYKRHVVYVEMEEEGFSIQVHDEGGHYAYDGVWDQPGARISDAVEEALRGSLLLPQETTPSRSGRRKEARGEV